MTPFDPVAVEPYAGALLVTLLYVGVYYAFQINVLRVKVKRSRAWAARGEKLDRYANADRELLAADRYQLNTLEHMGPFLVLLWLVAVFVGPGPSTWGGLAYVAARAAYPFAMGSRLGRSPRTAIFLSTVPGYAVLTWWCVLLIGVLMSRSTVEVITSEPW